jgi:drug/metabolite transporter (DMT)-like permease
MISASRGIVLALSGMLLIVAQDAVTKRLVAELTPEQIMALRGIASLPMIVAIAAMRGELRLLAPRRLPINLARAAAAFLVSAGIILSVALVPFAEAIVLFYSAPIFTLLLAPWLIGERPDLRGWIAVALGLAGTILIVKPYGALFSWGSLVPIAAALALAVQDIATRRAHDSESSMSLLFMSVVVATLGGLALLPLRGHGAPSGPALGLIALAAAMSSLAHLATIASLRHLAASAMAPLRYLGALWAAALGWMFWGEVPDPMSVVGALLIIAAGLLAMRAISRR